jgi:flagellar assembly protein FliH
VRIEVFGYPAGPTALETRSSAWDGLGISAPEERVAKACPEPAEKHPREVVRQEEWERRVADEGRRAFEAGRERGRQEAQAVEKETCAALLEAESKRHREQAAGWVARLMEERERSLRDVEQEVVKLALAVAARIMRREAQMDPLLLSGAVRVALGQLSDSTEVRLKVPAADLELWTEAIALLPKLAVKPTVLAGDGMRLGDVGIDTQMGSVDLGVRAQLGEIERGFFDRAGSRRDAVGPKESLGVQEVSR